MTSTTCWHCKKLAQMVCPEENADGSWNPMPQNHIPVFPDGRFAKTKDDGSLSNLLIYSCASCGYPNIAEMKVVEEETRGGYIPEEHIVRWLPIEPLGKAYPDVPDAIADVASEVHKCLEIDANRAAVALARTALEGIVSDQEGTTSGKRLYERIAELAESGKLKPRTAEAATALRLCGNSSVHDTAEEIDREFAEIIVQILDSILDDLYSNPTLVSRATKYAKRRKLAEKERAQ